MFNINQEVLGLTKEIAAKYGMEVIEELTFDELVVHYPKNMELTIRILEHDGLASIDQTAKFPITNMAKAYMDRFEQTTDVVEAKAIILEMVDASISILIDILNEMNGTQISNLDDEVNKAVLETYEQYESIIVEMFN